MSSRLVHLVRHGETVGESSIRYWGRTDVALSDGGRAQLQALATHLAPLHVDAVVHSPLQRAVESARILVERLDLGVVPMYVEPGFTEIDFGAFEGLTREEIAARDPDWFAVWQRGEHHGFPDGDRLDTFAARVQAAFARVRAALTGDILVVVHRGVIRHIANAVAPGVGDEATDLASVSTLDLHAGTPTRWNVRGT